MSLPSIPLGLFTCYFPTRSGPTARRARVSSIRTSMCQETPESQSLPHASAGCATHGTMPWLGLCSLSSDFPILFWIIHTRFILVLAVPFPSWGGPSLCSGALWINSTGQQALLPFTTQRLGGRKRNSPDSVYRDVSNRAGQGGVQVRCLSIKYLGVCMSLFGTEGFISKWWALRDVKRGKITFLDKS